MYWINQHLDHEITIDTVDVCICMGIWYTCIGTSIWCTSTVGPLKHYGTICGNLPFQVHIGQSSCD